MKRFLSTNVNHAVVSTFDLFSIGIGPSSSHTVGPMRASRIFAKDLSELSLLSYVANLRIDLYGSLALTGKGHATDTAVLLGLQGETPELVDVPSIPTMIKKIQDDKKIFLDSSHEIEFDMEKHLLFHYRQTLPFHPNGMRFSAFNCSGDLICTNEFFSTGGQVWI